MKKQDRGEADQLLTIYTKDFGKLEVLARAIRKITSKLRQGTEIFYLSEIEFVQGKTYKTLTDAVLIGKFKNIRRDLRRLRVAYKISEVFDELVRAPEKDPKIWRLLKEVFGKLDDWEIGNSENWKLKIIYYYFFWNLLSILGYGPELYSCAVCQKKLQIEKLFFSPKEGGVICSKCQKKLESTIEGGIEADTIKILRIILKKDLVFAFRLRIENSHLKSLSKISREYFSYIRNIFVIL